MIGSITDNDKFSRDKQIDQWHSTRPNILNNPKIGAQTEKSMVLYGEELKTDEHKL